MAKGFCESPRDLLTGQELSDLNVSPPFKGLQYNTHNNQAQNTGSNYYGYTLDLIYDDSSSAYQNMYQIDFSAGSNASISIRQKQNNTWTSWKQLFKSTYTITCDTTKWFDGHYLAGAGHRIPLNIPSYLYDVTANITKVEIYVGGWKEISYNRITQGFTDHYLDCNEGSTASGATNGQSYIYRVTGTLTITAKTP